MIEEFEAWFREHEPQFKDSSVQVEVTKRDIHTRAIMAELESEWYIASIALWEAGGLDIHILSKSKADAVYAQRYDPENVTEMLSILEGAYCKFLHHSLDSV
ncbi:MAG TPA: hypothetical protein VIC84_17130 [Blastocatellia bacterium]|jgi:hypothetical protein